MQTMLPPGPRCRIPGGLFLKFQLDPFNFLTKLVREYGDIVHFNLGTQRIVLLNHPDYIRDVLVTHQNNFTKGRALEKTKRLLGEGLLTNEGASHLRQRRLIQPLFHKQKIESYGSTMILRAERMRNQWRDQDTIDVSHEMARLTLAIVGDTLFGMDVEGDAIEVRESMKIIADTFRLLMLPFSEYLEKLPLPGMIRIREALNSLDEVVYRMIKARRQEGVTGHDLLSLLLSAQDEEEGGGMTDKQVRDEALTLFLAGHETTSNALTWTWLLLSQNPEVEKRFHAELDSVFENRPPVTADASRLSYTNNILAESMRLYPPAWILGRRAIEDYPVGNYLVPSKSVILMSQYLIHRDPRFYKNPEVFDPDRWMPEVQRERPKFAYFPFGAGTRVCIGEQFAWMEAVLLLATIGQKWRLRLVPDHPVVMQPVITLRPKFGIKMQIQSR